MRREVAPLDGFPSPYGLLCAVLRDATRDWRSEFDWSGELAATLGPEVVTWRVRPGGPCIGSLLMHMTLVEVFWFEEFVLGRETALEDKELLKWDEFDVDNGVWPEAHTEPLSWYFVDARPFSVSDVGVGKGVARPRDRETWLGNEYVPEWVLGHVIQHESYHGGQVVMVYDQWRALPS